jgi:hypothetical protein
VINLEMTQEDVRHVKFLSQHLSTDSEKTTKP